MPEFLSNLSPLIVFLGIAALGFVFLLISLVVGDIFDSFGFDTGLDGVADGHGFLDSRVISVFVTAFGGFGAIGIQAGLSIVASSLLGLGGGIVLGGDRLALRAFSLQATINEFSHHVATDRSHRPGDRFDRVQEAWAR